MGLYEQEGEGEAGAATIQQRYQGDVLVVGVMVEETVTMETTTADPEETGITDRRPDKTEVFLKYQVNSISQSEGLDDSKFCSSSGRGLHRYGSRDLNIS